MKQGAHPEPLINLKVGPWEKDMVLLVSTGATQSSLNFKPRDVWFSGQKLKVSGVKEEGFLVPIFEAIKIRLGKKGR